MFELDVLCHVPQSSEPFSPLPPWNYANQKIGAKFWHPTIGGAQLTKFYYLFLFLNGFGKEGELHGAHGWGDTNNARQGVMAHHFCAVPGTPQCLSIA